MLKYMNKCVYGAAFKLDRSGVYSQIQDIVHLPGGSVTPQPANKFNMSDGRMKL